MQPRQVQSSTKDVGLLVEISRRYFGDGRTQRQIAMEFALGLSTVSRLLNLAREKGIVRTTIESPSKTEQNAKYSAEKIARLVNVSELYFQRRESQLQISYELGVSPSAISRMLKLAQEIGIVHHNIESSLESDENIQGDFDEAFQSDFASQITYHISRLTVEVMEHPEFDPDNRDTVLLELSFLQDELLRLEVDDDQPLAEKMAMMQASLREIHHHAPRWVMARIQAMFSDQALAASMGAALGAALTAFLK